MVTILNAPEKPQSFSSRLGGAIGSGFSQGFSNELESQREMRRDLAKALMGQSSQGNQGLSGVMSALDRLETLSSKKGIGMSSIFNPFTSFGESAKNRGEFETTVASLLPAFKALFPRGFTEKEFKTITEKYLPAYLDSEERMKGKIKGLRQMVSHLSGGGSVEELPQGDILDPGLPFMEEKSMPSERKERVRFDIANPEHVAKRNQLMKAYKNDREKVRKALNREFLE